MVDLLAIVRFASSGQITFSPMNSAIGLMSSETIIGLLNYPSSDLEMQSKSSRYCSISKKAEGTRTEKAIKQSRADELEFDIGQMREKKQKIDSIKVVGEIYKGTTRELYGKAVMITVECTINAQADRMNESVLSTYSKLQDKAEATDPFDRSSREKTKVEVRERAENKPTYHSRSDLEIVALHIDGAIKRCRPHHQISLRMFVEETMSDIIDDEDALPHDLADSDDEDLVNVEDDDGVEVVYSSEEED
ncbi:hypothetical protein Tco_0637625 [Tanacetum coccineum]